MHFFASTPINSRNQQVIIKMMAEMALQLARLSDTYYNDAVQTQHYYQSALINDPR